MGSSIPVHRSLLLIMEVANRTANLYGCMVHVAGNISLFLSLLYNAYNIIIYIYIYILCFIVMCYCVFALLQQYRKTFYVCTPYAMLWRFLLSYRYNVSVTSIGLTRETIEWERNERMIITLYIIYQTIIHLEQYVMICG